MGSKGFNVSFYLPEGSSEILHNIVSKYQDKAHTWYPKYVYTLSTINVNTKYSEYCRINSTILSSILGCNKGATSLILKDLITAGLIEKKIDYQVGVRSNLFRAKTTDHVEVVKINSHASVVTRKIYQKHNKEFKTAKKGLKSYYSYLSNISVINNPNIQNTLYTAYVGRNLCNELEHSTIEYYIKSGCQGYDKIRNGEFYCLRPDNKSRVYTNLTNLHRVLRPYLRYNGKRFIELDIRNSQPLLATILIKQYYKGSKIPKDVIQYQSDCEKGVFYDYFMKLNNISSDDRVSFKIRFFAEVFFSKVSKRSTKLKKQFMERYPSCYKAISDMKGGLDSDSYNQFAIRLQQVEAGIIFDNVNMGLINMRIPAFNIFDSLLVTSEEDYSTAEEMVKSAFEGYGLSPSINKNYY